MEKTLTLLVATTGVMTGSAQICGTSLKHVGTNPTFKFCISGNPNLYVNVKAFSPTRNEFTVFRNIRCDGKTHSKFHFSLIKGSYYFIITINHGFSVGEKKDYTIFAEWSE